MHSIQRMTYVVQNQKHSNLGCCELANHVGGPTRHQQEGLKCSKNSKQKPNLKLAISKLDGFVNTVGLLEAPNRQISNRKSFLKRHFKYQQLLMSQLLYGLHLKTTILKVYTITWTKLLDSRENFIEFINNLFVRN